MANFIDRLSHDSEQMTPSRPIVRGHAFAGFLTMLAGIYSPAVTIASLRAHLEVPDDGSDEDRQFEQIVAAVTTGNITTKINNMLRIEAVCYVIGGEDDSIFRNGDGTMNYSAVYTAMGIAG